MELRQLLEYTFWAEDRYFDYCMNLSTAQFTDIFSEFDKSMKDILYHLYSTYRYWYHFLTDQDYSYSREIGEYSREDIIDGMKRFQEIFMDYVNTKDLTQTFQEQWDDNDTPVTTTAENIIFNFVTHSAYHRGQLALMLRQHGFENIEMTDFNPYIYKMGQR